MAEGKETPSRSFLSKLKRGDGRPGEMRKWLDANWAAMVMLLFIFVLALFVRSYFAYDISQDNGYIVSGGSDSYYWRRIIDYSADTGKQLFWDPLTAYPDGIRNPRPPLFSMSVVVPSVIAQDLFQSLDDALGFTFVWSTAFWGALTVVPTYFLGKETFGRRAGLVAAFFLALMPSHVQRSVLSNADHDAIILFFIVLTFYFLLKAVKNQQHLKWVENWRSISSIRKGLGDYFRQSRTAVLYALMAGMAFGSIIMTWVGFAYVAVLILAYFIIQILFNKFRNVDSMSVMILVFIAMGFGYLLSYPVYYEQLLLPVRFDVPVYLFLGSMLFGFLFVVSRDLPWTIVIPAVAGVVIVGVAVISAVDPALGQAILSGQGYFVKSKLYSTIAEARAPRFSELAMSFGVVTFFLSLIGLIWAIVKMPKRTNAAYIFMVVWLGAAIFMAISAGRFMFNAAPAFAIASAWVLVIIVDRLDFNSVRKSITGASGSYWQIMKKSIKLRHVVGALFLAFMIILPNVWYSVDAGIPSETKQKYDLQIYKSIPSFMRPGGYDVNGTNWYLGAFGYQLPLPSYYFPAAWSWFAEQDSDVPPVERPAFVAWWDYGFEAIQEGQHPTVADNFQNGYQLTGNAIMAQSEEDTIAIFAYKLIQAAWSHSDLKAKMHSLFEKYGVSVANMDDILEGPGQPIIEKVLSDSLIYGPMASDLSDPNARIVAARVELSSIGIDSLVSLYGEICETTGWQISYFMVDSRMFPLSGQSTGIFYAPAKLSDRRISSGSTPTDFFTIKAVLSTGAEVDLDKVTSSDTVTDYTLSYKDMFWDSMFYRAMVGYSPSDIGQSNDVGIPGWSSSLYTFQPMPGWNLTHFKMVYRTAYYNSWPVGEVSKHSDAWTAVNIEDAVAMKKMIDAGTLQGYVDQSAGSYYRAGAVFLKYYPGAIVNGTLLTEQGDPAANVRVTVRDEFGIPHQVVMTDNDGRYSVIAPEGNVTLTFSTGAAANQNLVGTTTITSVSFNVTEDQAMRAPYDANDDGILDYYITKNVVMKGTEVKGDIFWDMDGDKNYTSGDVLVPSEDVFMTDINSGREYRFDASEGSFDALVPPGEYGIAIMALGRNITAVAQLNVTYNEASSASMPLSPGRFNGTLFNEDGTPAGGFSITLTDVPYGYERTATTATNGSFSFNNLLEGKYSLTTTEPGKMIFSGEITVSEGQTSTVYAVIQQPSTINYRVMSGGAPVPYALYSIFNFYNTSQSISGAADAFGKIDAQLPQGLWTLYATYYTGSERYAATELVSTESSLVATGSIDLKQATDVTGVVRGSSGSGLGNAWVSFQGSNGAKVSIMADQYGAFSISLPEDTYGVTSQDIASKAMYSGSLTLSGSIANPQIKLVQGVLVSGTLWALKDTNLLPSDTDRAAFGELRYTDGQGNTFTSLTGYNGSFEMVFPANSSVVIGLGNSEYSEWIQNASFSTDSSDIGLIAYPNSVVVSGYVRFEGAGLRNVQVSFLPDVALAPAVYTTTGAGGFYSALVPPSHYSVVIDQATGPGGGEKYQYSADEVILPSDSPESMDLQPVKRLELHGTTSGGGLNVQLKFEGPEETTVASTSAAYSVYLLPGTYSVYATSSLGSTQYANISSVAVLTPSEQQDLLLTKAYPVSGSIRIGSTTVTKTVTITAESSTGVTIHSKSSSPGSYTVSLPKGSYTLSFLVEDILSQGSSKLYVEYFDQQTVSIDAAGQVVNASLLMRLDNTTFSGTVSGSDGVPAQSFVELFASGAYGQSTSFMTGPSGEFSESVQPGDYTAYVTRPQDLRVSLEQISFTRNVVLQQNITIYDSRSVSGTVTTDGVGAELQIAITKGNAKLNIVSDASGAFEVMLPPADYTLTASKTVLENGLNISYSGSKRITVAGDNLYVQFPLTRDARRGVTASWDRALTQSAPPGTPVTYVIQVTNTGNIKDSYTFSYTGQSTDFDVTFPSSEVTVDFGANNGASAEVTVTAKSKLSAGDTKIPIQVRSKSSSATRTDLNLYLKVGVVRGVLIYEFTSTKTVSSMSTESRFSLNNTGNAQDNFVLQVSNLDTLNSLGWNAEIVDPDTGNVVPSVGMPAFYTTTVGLRFTAIRANPDPTAEAIVYVYSTNDPGVNTYSSVAVLLPDLSIGKGDLSVTRSDVSYVFNVSIVYVDLAMVVAIASLLVGMFYLRRKKGLGRKAQAGGGKK